MYVRVLPWQVSGAYMHHMKVTTTFRPLAIVLGLAGCSGGDSLPSQNPMAVGSAGTTAAPAAGTSSAAGTTSSGSAGKVASGTSGAGGTPAAVSGGAGSPAGGTTASGSGGAPAAGTEGSAGMGSSAGAGGAAAPTSEPVWNDPGAMPWQLVPTDKVAAECKLDPAMLAANNSKFGSGWAVVRYGKLCHE